MLSSNTSPARMHDIVCSVGVVNELTTEFSNAYLCQWVHAFSQKVQFSYFTFNNTRLYSIGKVYLKKKSDCNWVRFLVTLLDKWFPPASFNLFHLVITFLFYNWDIFLYTFTWIHALRYIFIYLYMNTCFVSFTLCFFYPFDILFNGQYLCRMVL